MGNDKLLPCPFCGGEAEYFGEALMGSLTCSNGKCKAGMLVVGLEELKGLNEQWNTRHITRADIPESIVREIQAEALEYAGEMRECDNNCSDYLYAEAAKLREGGR